MKKEDKNREKAQEYKELGKFYFLNRRYEEAISAFKEALKLDPADATVYYSLGVSYEGINAVDEARECFKRALEIDPNLESAQEHLDKLIGE